MGAERYYHRDRIGRFAQVADAVQVSERSPDGTRTVTGEDSGGWSGGMDPPGDVEMVSARYLRENIRYGIDGFAYHSDSGWNRLLERARADPRSPGWMDDIARNGMEPIQVVWEDVPDGRGGTLRAGEIVNGNHRLALAVLMDLVAVPTSRRDYESWDLHERSSRVRVRLPGT